MAGKQHSLIGAFHEDHALLGRGFHEISAALRANSLAEARRWAERLDREGGAHIAFEERFFYPTLERLLGAAEVAGLYEEHEDGLIVVRQLCAAVERVALPEEQRQSLLSRSEAMERHIADCGELFEAIGRISAVEQDALYRQLVHLRCDQPGWIDYADQAKGGAVDPAR